SRVETARVRSRLPAVVVAVAVVLMPVTAHASPPVTTQQLHELAVRAEHDPHALDRLEDVTVVDGRPVDMRALLSGTPEERLARVKTLAAGGAGASITGARDRAGEIAGESRFHPVPIPRPLEGLFRSIADALTRVFDTIAAHFPFHAAGLWAAIGALVLITSILVTRRMTARRAPQVRYATTPEGASRSALIKDLERRAREAEGRGELDEAFRLLFRVALLRLDAAHAISYRESLPTHDIARGLSSTTFDALASRFERVAYGGAAATSEDLREAHDPVTKIIQESAA
ncbi:MAG: hypothetical protein ABR579_08135, partial [Actinomycetota bacterium]